jgi:hypothetical protein
LKFKETSTAQQKKRSQYFCIPTSETPPFFQSPKKAQKLHFYVFKKKTKSKSISLKSHIRGRNPLYRLKPEFGKKNLEIQRNQPGPAKKKVPVFSNSHQRDPPFFPKPQNSAKYTVQRFFFFFKNTKKTSPKKKRGPDAFTDAYRSVLKNPYKKNTFCWLAQISFFFRFLDASRIADHLENAA